MALTVTLVLATTTMVSSVPLARAEDSDGNAAILDRVSGVRMSGSIDGLAAYNTRAFYTGSCINSSVYIHDAFAELGLWVYYQGFTVAGFPARNVIAVKNGTNPAAPQYLFGAHYDSTNRDAANYSDGGNYSAPGADDDASGVAAVLEIARLLDESTFESTIKFAAFSAEESGLNGSRYFVERESQAGVEYADTAIMDMIGFSAELENRAMVFAGTSTPLSSAIVSAVGEYGLDLTIELVTGYAMVASDHASFWQFGYPSMLVIEQLVNHAPVYPYYHTANDTIDHLSINQMVVITKAVLGGFLLTQTPVEDRGMSPIPILAGVAFAIVVLALIVYVIVKRRRMKLEFP